MGQTTTSGEQPDISIVIPTYNRCARLLKVLTALNSQIVTAPSGEQVSFEVLVVSDGSTDGTVEAVGSFSANYLLRIVDQPNGGPAAARNSGIDASRGPTIVFLDDDVIPEPGWLLAHFRHHPIGTSNIVIGPMLTPTDVTLSAWVAWEQRQLEKQYTAFERQPKAYARQFYTGNASAPAEALRQSGGFNTDFRRAEDVELANRLHLAGHEFVFEPQARAYHYAERSFQSWHRMAYDYGRHNVTFASRDQPDLLRDLRWEFSNRHPLQRRLVITLIPHTRIRRFVEKAFSTIGRAAYRMRLRSLSAQLLSATYGLRYYSGVADGLGSAEAFRKDFAGDRSLAEPNIVFVLEQTLGHVTHSANLQRIVPDIAGCHPVFVPVPFGFEGTRLTRLLLSNWTIRAGFAARRSLRRLRRTRPHEPIAAMFVHTQVVAVMLGRWMRRIPTIVSVDATPMQLDSLGAFYAHSTGSRIAELLKREANRRSFMRAAHVVAWSQWAKQGLVDGYGVPAERISVIPPGVDTRLWHRPAELERVVGAPLQILFVGGDLKRKGGDVLIEACRVLQARPEIPAFELHLVTGADVEADPWTIVHHGLQANSDALIAQYHSAAIFCLPTLGDCLPMVLAEAGAAGLPIVASDVGAISEIVQPGVSGTLVAAGDLDGLVSALSAMLSSSDLRRTLGNGARELVDSRHSARTNAAKIVDLLHQIS